MGVIITKIKNTGPFNGDLRDFFLRFPTHGTDGYEPNPYADIFWCAYLGTEVYALHRILAGKFWDYGRGLPSQIEDWMTWKVIAVALGRSPYDALRVELDRLHKENIINIWTDRNGHERVYVRHYLPMLSVKQVATLPATLQKYHEDTFDLYIEWGVHGWNGYPKYEEWFELTADLDTLMSPFTDPEEIERKEIEAEREWERTRPERIRRELTADKKKAILERDQYTCRYCGQPSNAVDHIIPIVQGGDNDPGNPAAACTTCNSKKHGRTPDEAGMALAQISQPHPSQPVPIS